MKVLLIGHNRSGTTLTWTITQSLLGFDRIAAGRLVDAGTSEASDLFYSFSTLGSYNRSLVSKKDSCIKGIESRFQIPHDTSRLPNNTSFRVNGISTLYSGDLSEFDKIILIRRQPRELIRSNLNDVPPAFDLFNIDTSIAMRDFLTDSCRQKEEWKYDIPSHLNCDYAKEIYDINPNVDVCCVDFEHLLQDPKRVISDLCMYLAVERAIDDINAVIERSFWRSHSKWKSNYVDRKSSQLEGKALVGYGLNDLNLLSTYKTMVFCGEFQIKVTGPSKKSLSSDKFDLHIDSSSGIVKTLKLELRG